MELCARNETAAECVGAQADALQSATGNGSLEMSNTSNGSLLASQGNRQKGERQTAGVTEDARFKGAVVALNGFPGFVIEMKSEFI